MVDPPTGAAFSSAESSVYKTVQALLKEKSGQRAWEKGLIRWSLQKKLEDNPSCSVSLIRVLIKELDKLLQMDKVRPSCYTRTIPVLHTLYYVVMQSGVTIPTSVYQALYECMMKLLILPSPCSSVVLSTLRSIQVEMTTPGSLYLRRVAAEQNLKNEHFTSQEKVFVLTDPAVFPAPLEAAVRAHFEACSFLNDASATERNVLLRVLQTGLGTSCQGAMLTPALEALGDRVVETYFQEVVLAAQESLNRGAGGRESYLDRLQHIYRDILTASQQERTQLEHAPALSTAMPYPEINFLLWKDQEDLWKLLENIARCCGSVSTTVDEEEEDKRDSVRSQDSGIEKDLKEGRPSFKEDGRRHTARVVVLGDDRALGRLSRAYHSIRHRESKHLILSRKLNLRLYYIPVTDAAPSHPSPGSPREDEGRLCLASLLGRVDPWYNSNINSVGAAISKLAGKQSVNREPAQPNAFLLDTLCYYLRCGTQTVNLPLYSVKMTRSSCDVVEEVFVSHLEADVPEFRHLKGKRSKEPIVRQKKSSVEVFHSVISVSYTEISLSKREVVKREAPMTFAVVITSAPTAATSGEDPLTVKFHSVNPENNTTIQTQNISIRALQHRTLSVCLDQDARSTYTGIQRVEISPCLHPGCGIGSRSTQELQFNKYLDRAMHLPINTFTGVSP